MFIAESEEVYHTNRVSRVIMKLRNFYDFYTPAAFKDFIRVTVSVFWNGFSSKKARMTWLLGSERNFITFCFVDTIPE